MRINIIKYTKKVISEFSNANKDKLTYKDGDIKEFMRVISEVNQWVADHYIKDYDVWIEDSGKLIKVLVDIGYFNEDIADSHFIQLLERCVKFEIHPGGYSKFIFFFKGFWSER